MSENFQNNEVGKSKMAALLAMLKYISDELGTIDTISQFCVDMAIHQLSDKAHSMSMHFGDMRKENTIQ